MSGEESSPATAQAEAVEELLRQLVDARFVLTDRDGAVTRWSRPAEEPFGCDCVGLSISDDIGVCGPPPASACDLLDPASCPEGQACQLPGGSFGVCGTPGNLGEGETCFGEVCAAGLDCFGDDPASGFSGTCYRFCDLTAPSCEFCFDVGTGSLGRCFL